MRYGILSDIHSNLEALNAVMGAFLNEAIDQYLCVGDIVGYAANPRECIEKVQSLNCPVVAGNHDWACVSLFSLEHFNPIASEAVLWTRSKLSENNQAYLESLKLTFKNKDLALVHGTLDNPQDFSYMTDGFVAEETFRLMDAPICFIGHTHVPGIFTKDGDEQIHYREDSSCDLALGHKYIVNVGSVGQPRDGNTQAAYCIYDTVAKKVEIKRAPYEIELTRKKINSAGLPEYLSHRLFLGR